MKNIKKLIVGCIGVILTVAVITTGAVAAGGTDRGKGYGSGTGTICRGIGYADTDGDGICDYRDAATRGAGFADADGDGICDYRGSGGRGAGFTDADGDGICDYRSSGSCGGRGACLRRGFDK